MSSPRVRVRRLRPEDDSDLPLPSYQTVGSAGADLYAANPEPITLQPERRVRIPTGLAFEIESGWEVQLRPRSGLAWKHGITLLNTPGTIDADYRGEVQVILINLGEAAYTIHRGDRIAQMVVAPATQAEIIGVDALEGTARGTGGFGHTGA